MSDGTDKNGDGGKNNREEIFSRAVRAGKRTYFFDVKATRRNDYYLTLTESKKRFNRDGRFYFEKHKIFLYKEDFEKFSDGLAEVIEFINNANPEIISKPEPEVKEETRKEDAAEAQSAENNEKNASDYGGSASDQNDEAEHDSNSPLKSEPSEKIEQAITENYTSDVEFEDLEDSRGSATS